MRLSPAGPAIRPPPRNLAAADDGPPRQAHVPAASLSCLAMLSSRATQAAGFADLEFPAWAAQDPGPGAAQDPRRGRSGQRLVRLARRASTPDLPVAAVPGYSLYSGQPD